MYNSRRNRYYDVFGETLLPILEYSSQVPPDLNDGDETSRFAFKRIFEAQTLRVLHAHVDRLTCIFHLTVACSVIHHILGTQLFIGSPLI